MIKVQTVSGNMVTCNFNYSLQAGKGLFLELVLSNFTYAALFIVYNHSSYICLLLLCNFVKIICQLTG